jgi:condensin-2 complex subunit G2
MQDRATSTGRATDIKAVYSMRAGLELFDYEDPSINDLKRLLLLAAMHPGFLHRQEGRKLVAYTFQLHLPLVQELTAIIKNQVCCDQAWYQQPSVSMELNMMCMSMC